MEAEESEHLLYTARNRKEERSKYIVAGVVLTVVLLLVTADIHHKSTLPPAPSVTASPILDPLPPTVEPVPNVVCGFVQAKDDDIPPPSGPVMLRMENDLGFQFAWTKIRWNGKLYTSATISYNPTCNVMHLSLMREDGLPALFLVPVQLVNGTTANWFDSGRIDSLFSTYTSISLVTQSAQHTYLMYNHAVPMNPDLVSYWLNTGMLHPKLHEIEGALINLDPQIAHSAPSSSWPPVLGAVQQSINMDYATTNWENYRFVQMWEGNSLFFFLFYADFGGHLCFFATRPAIDPPHANATLMQLDLPSFSSAIRTFYFYNDYT